MSKRYSLSLSDGLAEHLEKMASEKEMSVQDFIRELLRAYVSMKMRKDA